MTEAWHWGVALVLWSLLTAVLYRIGFGPTMPLILLALILIGGAVAIVMHEAREKRKWEQWLKDMKDDWTSQ